VCVIKIRAIKYCNTFIAIPGFIGVSFIKYTCGGGFFDSISHPAGGGGVRLDILIRRALRNASPAEAERIRRALRDGRVAEVLPELVKLAEREGPLDIYYVWEVRFEAAEEREEAVGEVEEAVAEDGLEPVGEVEEVV
jgi:hypothetical protein